MVEEGLQSQKLDLIKRAFNVIGRGATQGCGIRGDRSKVQFRRSWVKSSEKIPVEIERKSRGAAVRRRRTGGRRELGEGRRRRVLGAGCVESFEAISLMTDSLCDGGTTSLAVTRLRAKHTEII